MRTVVFFKEIIVNDLGDFYKHMFHQQKSNEILQTSDTFKYVTIKIHHINILSFHLRYPCSYFYTKNILTILLHGNINFHILFGQCL